MTRLVLIFSLVFACACARAGDFAVNAVRSGADATGRADASAALQKALDALEKAEGGTLYLPAGRYRLDKPLRIGGGVTLRGEWRDPRKGGFAKDTLLCVYGGRGETNLEAQAAVRLSGGACLRDVTIWHPEQKASAPVPYSASIWGDGHTSVENVTLVNSWCGFYNNHCSSMLVRGLRGTVLDAGIRAAYAFDVPRIEHVAFDPAYWAASGLPGAPQGKALRALEAWCERTVIGIVAGEQDWGYWWDVTVNHAKAGAFLTVVPDNSGKKASPGNIAVGQVDFRNVLVGVELQNVGYPGFLLTYGTIDAKLCCLHYSKVPAYTRLKAMGLKPYYSDNAAIQVTGVTLSGAPNLFLSEKEKDRCVYGINFNDCTFRNWKENAIKMPIGNLVVSNCRFEGKAPAIDPGARVSQIVLNGNRFGGPVFRTKPAAETVVRRDDAEKGVLSVRFAFEEPVVRTFKGPVFDVREYGATAGKTDRVPEADSAPAIADALKAAEKAGGGVVYVPAGVYRMSRGVTVPSGVELRGSFESQHYGNSTHCGTQLYAFGGKDRTDGEPIVTLSADSAVGGFTVFYPEQGWSDASDATEEARIKKYPPTVRTAPRATVRNLAVVNGWTVVDAMTVRSDGLTVSDVTGAALGAGLVIGHGTTGGVVRDVHFNFTGWVGQGRYATHPRGDDWDKSTTCGSLADFTTRETKGFVFGDVKDVKFLSCFSIMVAEGAVFERDPHTGGDFRGTTWGFAFDANTNGLIGRRGSAAKAVFVAAMGVFSRQQGGYFVCTEPGFAGTLALLNSEMWSGRSRIVNLAGGSTLLSQFLSWCCYEGVVKSGAALHVGGTTFASNNGNDKGEKATLTFEPGASGSVRGSLDGRRFLRLVDGTGGRLKLNNNGVTL